MDYKTAIRRSALWAAYGDALGFITELADSAMVERRSGTQYVSSLLSWHRRIGGRFGVNVTLPAGCYSDDTQLRLACCRGIGNSGTLDVEVFSKIELPVWRAYALGAGHGTKAAAQSLTRPDAQWCGNFFRTQFLKYVDSGGNGAAMRIQPHVWSSALGKRDSEIVLEIVRNALITHGHPRGILGAAFHGLCLRHVFKANTMPSTSDWRKIVENLRYTTRLIRSDDTLKTFWVSRWESESGRKLDEAFNDVLQEMQRDIALIEGIVKGADSSAKYAHVVQMLGGLDPNTRGSGVTTAILAAFVAAEFAGKALDAMHTTINLLGSDTDTIATMAGALLGALSDADPPEAVADEAYIVAEADRMYLVSQGQAVSRFEYPDLLYWDPPRAELDVLQRNMDSWQVAGLGSAKPLEAPEEKGGKNPMCWQWFKLDCGQSVLLKRRIDVDRTLQTGEVAKRGKSNGRGEVSERGASRTISRSRSDKTVGVEEAVTAAISSGFDPRVVGAMLLELASTNDNPANAIAFAERIAEKKKRQKGLF